MENTSSNVAPMPRRPRKGRKDSSGQEQVTKPDVIRARMHELEGCYNDLKEARSIFNEAVKAAAEDSGYNASAVRSHVVAVATDRIAQARAKVSQQLELFDSLTATTQ